MKEKYINHIIYIVNTLITICQVLATVFLYQYNNILGYTFLSLSLLCIFIVIVYSYFKKTVIFTKNISFVLCLFVGLICGFILFTINSIIGGFILTVPYIVYSIYYIISTFILIKKGNPN